MLKFKARVRKLYLLTIETLKSIIFFDSIPVLGVGGLRNFGDYLNIPLFQELTNKRVIKVRYSFIEKIKAYFNIGTNYCLIGSIVQLSEKNTIIWGAGLISKESEIKHKPKKVCAVRGPLTRKVLTDNGIECPEIYGDPALLLPLVYQVHIKPRYKLGIIPHYVDKNNTWISQYENNEEILIIDINTGYNWKKFVEDVLSCEKIISSSLHGLIVADAYKIPILWIEFSDKVVGEGFKFNDYFLSVGKGVKTPFLIKSDTKLSEILSKVQEEPIHVDYKKLVSSCPFNLDVIKSY